MLTFAHGLNALLMIALPLLLGFWLTRRFKLPWALYGWGALTFAVSQAFHIPFNQVLLNPLLAKIGFPDVPAGLVFGALLLGLSAGIFEELARFVFLRRWVHSGRSWSAGLLYGAGHGGIEAILLGVLALFSFIQAQALRGVDLNQVLEPGRIALAQQQLQAYWSMSPGLALLGAVERVFALVIQMSATLMVVTAVVRSERRWLFAAVIWHSAVDAVAVYVIQQVDVYSAEFAVFGFAIFAAVFIFWSRKSGSLPLETVEGRLPGMLRSGSSRVRFKMGDDQDQAQIEDSRYQ